MSGSGYLENYEREVEWFKEHFGDQVEKRVAETPFSVEYIYAFAWVASGHLWQSLSRAYNADEILQRCLFDGSGDSRARKGWRSTFGLKTRRSAFPRNTDTFHKVYGDYKTALLAEESNKTRYITGLHSRKYLYKKYGIFHYDLKHVVKDPDFFFEKEWYSFDACLERLMQELEIHYKETGSIQASIKKYAGEGEAADTFAQRVTSRAVSVMQEIDNVSLSKS